MEKLTCSASEASLKIGMSKAKTLHLLDTGVMPGIRMGRNWIIPLDALSQWLVETAYEEARERRAKQ